VVLVGVVVAIAGCAGTREGPSVQPFGAAPLQWAACPAPWEGPRIECARVEVPRRWAEPEGEKITIIARRMRATGTARGQLWALDGGPGFAGDVFFDPGLTTFTDRAGLDLIVPSHRGTVDQGGLTCPGVDVSSIEGWDACVERLVERWGEGIEGFDSTSAARDVAHLMDRVPRQGRRLVYGGSYGSLWGQRLLQVRPEGIDRVWLDSVVDLEGTLERSDEHAHAAMQELLRLCGEDSACRAMFDGPPLEVADRVRRAYGQGFGCGQGEGLELADLQALMFAWLSGPPVHWALATAGYARADRCEESDPPALRRALERLKEQPPDGAGFIYNPILNRHILYRELYRFDVDVEERTAIQSELLATRRADVVTATDATAFGPTWRVPGPVETPTTTTELILLSGRLDPLDLPDWAERTARRWPTAVPVFTPWAGHSVLRYLGTSEGQCGARLLDAFFAGEALPVACAEGQPGPDFSGEEENVRRAAEVWFGEALFER
jgi:hypothetical protein